MKRNLIAVIFFLLFFASEAGALTISPAKMLVTVDPGGTQTVVVKIRNDDSIKENYKITIFGVRQDEKGKPIFEKQVDESENWLRPEVLQISVKPAETNNVNFFINVPPDAQPGSHYLGLGIEKFSSGEEKINISGRLVSILNLQVSGLVNESVKIDRWKLADSKEGSYNFDLSIKNVGSIDVPMNGQIIISDLKGKELKRKSIELGNKLLVGSVRNIRANIDKPAGYGLYNAEVLVNYGRSGQTISLVERVWEFPTKTLIFSSIFLVILLIFMGRKIFRKK